MEGRKEWNRVKRDARKRERVWGIGASKKRLETRRDGRKMYVFFSSFFLFFFLEYFFFFLKENLGNNALELVYKSNEICRNERDSCASFRIRRKMTKALAFP